MDNFLIVGNSSGIGKALSEQLMLQGHFVHGFSRRGTGNVSKNYDIDINKDPLPEIDGPLNGIVYCPGTINLKPFSFFKPEDFQKDLEINVIGAIKVLRQYLLNLQMCESASVVLFSTVAVTAGMAYHSSVAVAKGAVEGLTRSLAAEWAPKIRVNCIAPSLTDTPLAVKLLDTDAKRSAAQQRHPLKVVGDSRDIASMAFWLLSGQSKFMTGQIIHIDGGMTSARL